MADKGFLSNAWDAIAKKGKYANTRDMNKQQLEEYKRTYPNEHKEMYSDPAKKSYDSSERPYRSK